VLRCKYFVPCEFLLKFWYWHVGYNILNIDNISSVHLELYLKHPKISVSDISPYSKANDLIPRALFLLVWFKDQCPDPKDIYLSLIRRALYLSVWFKDHCPDSKDHRECQGLGWVFCIWNNEVNFSC
jgi:hypothetical protein